MKSWLPRFPQVWRDSVLLRVGLAFGLLAILSFASIVISTVIAEDISGRANAVNVSGSLRMLSYRTLSEVLQPDKRSAALETMKTFERRLLGLERFIVAKSPADALSVKAVQGVMQRWNTHMRELERRAALGEPAAIRQLALEIPDYVDQIDHVVHLIESELEDKARLLRVAQLGLLALILVISALTIWMLRRQIVLPLADLVQAAQTVTRGSFSARVRHVGSDELGQLGRAFNAMVAEIATMYAHLEDKVAEKTRELKRSNESLELLYRVSQQLSASDLSLDDLRRVLAEVETALELGHSMICISENDQWPAHAVLGDMTDEEKRQMRAQSDCAGCFRFAALPLAEQARQRPCVMIPIGDGDRLRGIVPFLLREAEPLPAEKARLLETVGHHLTNALINMRRAEEKRRLAVLEERAVIARELHDSIAQSLSYLQIQVTRLEKSLERGGDAREIALELKRGLAAAYRELRELIVTFRLRIDARGFNVALQQTVAEFSEKLGFAVTLTNTLSDIALSGNEEMHVIRIIREALANIEHHARARHASVTVDIDAAQHVTVKISDDGIGFDPKHTPAHHFGVSIMHDRAQIIGGRLEVISAPGAGTTIKLDFVPQKYRSTAKESHE